MANNIIRFGLIDYFYVFRIFEPNHDSYENIINLLKASPIVINQEKDYKELCFKESFSEERAQRLNRFKKTLNPKYYHPDKGLQGISFNPNDPALKDKLINLLSKIQASIEEKESILMEDFLGSLKITINNETHSPELIIQDELFVSQIHFLRLLALINESEEYLTGHELKIFKERCLLRPFRIQEGEKNNFFYGGVYLTIYKSGVAILQFSSIPLTNMSFEQLSKRKHETDIAKAYLPNTLTRSNALTDYSLTPPDNNYLAIAAVYIKEIMKYSLLEPSKNMSVYTSIALIEYDTAPATFNDDQLSSKFKRNIYNLLYAPVYPQNRATNEKVNLKLPAHSYGNNEMLRYYFSSGPKSLAVFGRNYKTILTESYKEQFESQHCSEYQDFKFDAYEMALANLLPALEYVLQNKQSNDEFLAADINEKTSTIHDLYKIKLKLYSEETVQLSKAMVNFRSLYEMTNFIESIPNNVLNKDELVSTRLNALEGLISLKHEQFKHKITIVGLIVTIMLAALISLEPISFMSSVLGAGDQTATQAWLFLNSFFALFFILMFKQQIWSFAINIKKSLLLKFKFAKRYIVSNKQQ